MTQTIAVTKARNDLLKLVDKVDEDYARFDLTKKGIVKASLVSPEYLDSLEETIYTLENSMNDIKKAEMEIDRGDFVSLDDLNKDLQKRLRKHDRK